MLIVSALVHQQGSNGKQFEGNLFLWMKMLLPAANKQIYNLQSKQLIKLFAKLFNANQSDMATHLERGTRIEFYIKTSIESQCYSSHPMHLNQLSVSLCSAKSETQTQFGYATNCSILNGIAQRAFRMNSFSFSPTPPPRHFHFLSPHIYIRVWV